MKSTLSRPKARAVLLQELEHAVRRSSAQGVIFGQTVASRAGISGSDLDCLDFLILEGGVTAGRPREAQVASAGKDTASLIRSPSLFGRTPLKSAAATGAKTSRP